jgi:uncharacterized protein (DUF488 family)
MQIWTIGHSNQPLRAFLLALVAHQIALVADVRRFPASRRHPHFGKDALGASLVERGIAYEHFPELGGRRSARKDSHNTAWRVAGFRGYADYMDTPAFEQALDDLVGWSGQARSAVMCAEAVWWQCHRRLIADALLARAIEVRHIMTADAAPAHELTEFARLEAARVRYPGLL